jgi:hypothetical protein
MRLHQLCRSLCRPGAMVGRNLQVAGVSQLLQNHLPTN